MRPAFVIALALAVATASSGCLSYWAIKASPVAEPVKPGYFALGAAADVGFGLAAMASDSIEGLQGEPVGVRLAGYIGFGVASDALLAAIIWLVTSKPHK
jgi:hypothetical protein